MTLLNYGLTGIEFTYFHFRFNHVFSDKLTPIVVLFVSFILATQTFLLYKLAVVFDDWVVDPITDRGENKPDVFIQQSTGWFCKNVTE